MKCHKVSPKEPFGKLPLYLGMVSCKWLKGIDMLKLLLSVAYLQRVDFSSPCPFWDCRVLYQVSLGSQDLLQPFSAIPCSSVLLSQQQGLAQVGAST